MYEVKKVGIRWDHAVYMTNGKIVAVFPTKTLADKFVQMMQGKVSQ